LEEAEANATKLANNTLLLHKQAMQTLENRAIKAETAYSLLTEAIGYKKAAASASGRMSQASGNEELRAIAKAEKDEWIEKYTQALKSNPFLYEILEAKA
jgi:hypothetical protein